MGEGTRVNALLGQVEGRLTYKHRTTGKREKPFKLDMPGEALGRFATTRVRSGKSVRSMGDWRGTEAR